MYIVKNISSTFDFISNFQQTIKLSGLPFTDRNAQLSINDRELRLDFQLTTEEALKDCSLGFLNQFYVISNNGERYIAPDRNGVLNRTLNLADSDTELQNYHISIPRLMNEKWNEKEKYYYRFLLPIEKDVIDSRNRFLHGHILGHCFEESFQEIMYASLELQKLCTLLLFRESGFYGLIVNTAVLMGLKKAISAEEPVLV